MVSTDVLDRVSQYHRQWASRYSKGLAIDAILPGKVTSIGEGKTAPNIGFHHLIQAYYWTTMLITRPSLIESISRHMSKSSGRTGEDTDLSSVQALAHACVHSAVRTVDLLRGLISAEGVPKRLPFVVNCSFVAALVLGLAQFGDLDRVFSLRDNLVVARTVLLLFSRHDAVAKRNLAIVDDLQMACDLYLEKRERRRMERQSLLFSGLFGTVGGGYKSRMPLHGRPIVEGLQQIGWPPALGPGPVTDIQQFSNSDSSNILSTVGPEAQAWIDLGNELSGMVPEFGEFSDLIVPISPRLLMLDSLNDLSSFPAMATGTISVGGGLTDDSIASNTES
jgi:hypothetical protein